jgi:hypothetical protein
MLVALVSLCGCATAPVVIPSDEYCRFLKPGQTFTAPIGGTWLVPPARFHEMLHKYYGTK